MERIAQYRQLIQSILLPMEGWKFEYPNVHLVAIIDEKRDRYLVARTGWRKDENVYSLLIHIAIENGKVVIYQDNTDEEIYEQLLEGGIPEEAIIQDGLAFQNALI